MANKVCHVYMKKDLEKVGMAKQLVKVKQSYADNFLVPRGYAVMVKDEELPAYEKRNSLVSEQKQVLESKTSMLAEKIKTTPVVLKEKVHDDSRLYGSIKEDQIVQALRDKGIVINKKQVEFGKAIKSVGEFDVVIRLSSKLQPTLKVKVVSL